MYPGDLLGYAAKVADMERINQLIEEGALTDPRFRKIQLIEIATDHPAGYFNYFTERPQVFDGLTTKPAKSCWLTDDACRCA